MASWKLVLFDDGVKAHYISESLHKDILDELYARYLRKPFVEYDKDQAIYDVGGMVMVDEEWLSWITPPKDLQITMRVTHFQYAYDELLQLEEREVNGQKYYKLHGWLHCIVLTPAQRDYLLKQWAIQAQVIKEKSLLANLEFDKRISEVNKDKEFIISKPRVDIPKGKD